MFRSSEASSSSIRLDSKNDSKRTASFASGRSYHPNTSHVSDAYDTDLYLAERYRPDVHVSSTPDNNSGRGFREKPQEDLDEAGPSSSMAADSNELSSAAANIVADEAEQRIKNDLERLQLRLPSSLRICRDLSLEVLRQPGGFSDLREFRAMLDESTKLLFSETGHNADLVEIIGATLAAAYLRLGREASATYIFQEVKRIVEQSARELQRSRWKTAISEALRLNITDIASRILQSTSDKEVRAEDRDELISRFKRHMQTMMSSLAEEGTVRDVVLKASADASAHAFATLVSYYGRLGKVDEIKDVVELQCRLLSVDDLDLSLGSIARLHPRARRPDILTELLARDGVDAAIVFDKLVNTYAVDGSVRDLFRLFRMSGNSGTGGAHHKGRRIPLRASMVDSLIAQLARRSQANAAMHFFRLAKDRCSNGNLTMAFARVCWALQESNNAEKAIAFGLDVLAINPAQHAMPEARQPRSRWIPVLAPSRTLTAILFKICPSLANKTLAVQVMRALLARDFARGRDLNRSMLRAIASTLPAMLRGAPWEETAQHLEFICNLPQDVAEPHSAKARAFVDILHKEGYLEIIAASHKKSLTDLDFHEPSKASQRWMTETRLGPLSPPPQTRAPPSIASIGAGTAAATEMNLSEKLTAKGYALRLHVYGVIRRDYNSAKAIYNAMLFHGVQPTLRHAESIVESLVLQNRIEEARSVREGALAEMPRSPSALRIVTIIIRAFARQGRWGEVIDELRLAERLNIVPDELMYSVVSAAVRMARRDLLGTSYRLSELARKAESLLGARSRSGTLVPLNDTEKPRKTLTAASVTGLLQAKTQAGQLYEAQCDVAEALEAGVRPDNLMRDVLKSTERYLVREAGWAGYDVEDLIKAVEGKLDSDTETYDRFHSPITTIWGLYEGGKMTRRQRKRWAGPPKHPRELGYALHLSRQNRANASARSPQRVQERNRDAGARRAMMQLLHDAIGSSVLRDAFRPPRPAEKLVEGAKEEDMPHKSSPSRQAQTQIDKAEDGMQDGLERQCPAMLPDEDEKSSQGPAILPEGDEKIKQDPVKLADADEEDKHAHR